MLKYFDPQKEVALSVNASPKGIGAVLFQKDQPEACASKSLTTSQQNYAQIEKEMLAIIYHAPTTYKRGSKRSRAGRSGAQEWASREFQDDSPCLIRQALKTILREERTEYLFSGPT